jgi:hypothetical protein
MKPPGMKNTQVATVIDQSRQTTPACFVCCVPAVFAAMLHAPFSSTIAATSLASLPERGTQRSQLRLKECRILTA